jgi:hypothetical protein
MILCRSTSPFPPSCPPAFFLQQSELVSLSIRLNLSNPDPHQAPTKNPAKTSRTNRAACAEYVNMLFVCTPYAVPQSHLRRNDVGGDYGAAFAPSAKFPWFSTWGRNPPNCAMVVYKRTQAFPFRHLHTFVVLWGRSPISSTYKFKLNRLGCRSLPLLGCPETCFRISKFSPQTTNLEGCNM